MGNINENNIIPIKIINNTPKLSGEDVFNRFFYSDDNIEKLNNLINNDYHIPILLDPDFKYEKRGYADDRDIIGFALYYQLKYSFDIEDVDNTITGEAFDVQILEDDIKNKLLSIDKDIYILLYPKLRGPFLDGFTYGVLVDEYLRPIKLEDLEINQTNKIQEEKTTINNKRLDYISWDEYFMGIAKLSSLRSKDPKTQVGCCIVKDNKILSIGYNGMPNNCSDDKFPWNREDADPLNIKYLYVVHAELNAILNYKGESLEGSTIYVTLFPCNECTKAIIQSGIKNIVYLEERDSIETQASKRMLQSAGVNYTKYKPTNKTLNIDV